MTDERKTEHVKIRIRLRERGDAPAGEWMWAEPLDAHDGGGTYRLFNISHYVPLGLGDVVRGEIDGDGDLQVVAVVEPADAVWTRFCWARRLTDHEVRRMGDSWCERGSQWSEGDGTCLATMWPLMTSAEVRRALATDVRAGRGALVEIVEAAHRSTRHQRGIDFRLAAASNVPVTTTYWVGDDPWWSAHGYTAPDFLAFIQTAAGEDAPVARALEDGRHRDALRMLGFG